VIALVAEDEWPASDWLLSIVLPKQCAGAAAVTNHKSLLQTGTTDPGRDHRIGVTNDEADRS
jgi:hypothetical protein